MAAPAVAKQEKGRKSRKPFLGETCGMIVIKTADTLPSCDSTGSELYVAMARTKAGHLGFLKGGQEVQDGGDRRVTAAREVAEESEITLDEVRVVENHEFHEINEKGNLSVACWVAVYIGSADKILKPRDGDELDSTTWMLVSQALQPNNNLRPARQNMLRDAIKVLTPFMTNLHNIPLGTDWVIGDRYKNPVIHRQMQSVPKSVMPASVTASVAKTSAKLANVHILSDGEFPSLASAMSTPAPSKKQQRQQAAADISSNKSISDRILSTMNAPFAFASVTTSASADVDRTLSSKEANRLSHTMSKVLRHQVQKLGLKMRGDGCVSVHDMLGLAMLRGFTLSDVRYVVATNDKQRFAFDETGDYIRANQGHNRAVAAKIQDEQLFRKLENPLPVCVHGTYFAAMNAIRKDGLSRMSREFIHFAPGLPGEVISGMRASAQVWIYVDMAQAMADGIDFFESNNGVLLTRGDNGVLHPRYFAKIVDNA